MDPKWRDLQIQAFAECKTFEDGKFKTDEVFERFADLIVKDIMQVVAAHALSNDSAIEVFANLKRLYEKEQ